MYSLLGINLRGSLTTLPVSKPKPMGKLLKSMGCLPHPQVARTTIHTPPLIGSEVQKKKKGVGLLDAYSLSPSPLIRRHRQAVPSRCSFPPLPHLLPFPYLLPLPLQPPPLFPRPRLPLFLLPPRRFCPVRCLPLRHILGDIGILGTHVCHHTRRTPHPLIPSGNFLHAPRLHKCRQSSPSKIHPLACHIRRAV
jgi:hypothetical protein